MTATLAERAERLSAALGRIPTPIAISFSANGAPGGVARSAELAPGCRARR